MATQTSNLKTLLKVSETIKKDNLKLYREIKDFLKSLFLIKLLLEGFDDFKIKLENFFLVFEKLNSTNSIEFINNYENLTRDLKYFIPELAESDGALKDNSKESLKESLKDCLISDDEFFVYYEKSSNRLIFFGKRQEFYLDSQSTTINSSFQKIFIKLQNSIIVLVKKTNNNNNNNNQNSIDQNNDINNIKDLYNYHVIDISVPEGKLADFNERQSLINKLKDLYTAQICQILSIYLPYRVALEIKKFQDNYQEPTVTKKKKVHIPTKACNEIFEKEISDLIAENLKPRNKH
eukprot:TRINITY_DN649_c1_g1_i1.p1 TRINITY_DN649_c1_g1~~TRINITY_DN649_c1_g1_i1.p1  ORF type:complete len:293 (-),score=86.93 TRINITY_DN649_c1_g1_i1:176-1054(-)